MAYVLERERALRGRLIVAVLSVRRRKVRTRVVLTDNTWYHTLTRPVRLVQHAQEPLMRRLRAQRKARPSSSGETHG